VIKTSLSTAGALICVSRTCRENLLLRVAPDPSTVHVIPNAIDPTRFAPDPSLRSPRLTVVVVSRLAYRKGADLLAGLLPRVCRDLPVDFLIAGDGPKEELLREVVRAHGLEGRVRFLGRLPHGKVRDALVRGHVFLNCSLTESFCIALLEAACAGLYCVSTNVGGVPEVLPGDMVSLAEPTVEGLVEALGEAIERAPHVDPFRFHERIKEMYRWERVAEETLGVYREVVEKKRPDFLQRLVRYQTVGPFAGLFACLAALTVHFWVGLVCWWWPRRVIDVVPDFPSFKRPATK